MKFSVNCIVLGISARYSNGIQDWLSITSLRQLCNLYNSNDQTHRKTSQVQKQWYIFSQRYGFYIKLWFRHEWNWKYAILQKESQNVIWVQYSARKTIRHSFSCKYPAAKILWVCVWHSVCIPQYEVSSIRITQPSSTHYRNKLMVQDSSIFLCTIYGECPVQDT